MANEVQSAGGETSARAGAEQLKERTVERVEGMKEKAMSGKEKLSSQVRRFGSAIHTAGDQIRSENESWGHYADRVSERVESAAEYLRTTDPRQALRDVESFARRDPALFFGGAFLLGLAASRFLKGFYPSESTQTQESEESWAPYDEVGPYENVVPVEDVEDSVH